MLFKVGNEIIDTETTPVALIFKDKEEAKNVGSILSGIINGNSEFPTENNGDWWFMSPGNWTEKQRDEWSILTDQQRELLEKSGKVTSNPQWQL